MHGCVLSTIDVAFRQACGALLVGLACLVSVFFADLEASDWCDPSEAGRCQVVSVRTPTTRVLMIEWDASRPECP